MGVNIKVDKRNLTKLRASFNGNADRAMQTVAFMYLRDVLENFSHQSPSIPGQPPGVDTGALRASLHVHQERPLHWVCSDGVIYGAFLEYGTVKMAARPFLFPAAERIQRAAAQSGIYVQVVRI